jgi:N-acetylmuramoyl-L-alanine amidase
MESLSFRYGFFWKTIWKAPQNSDLRRKRDDPNTLFPGDLVYIPGKRLRQEQANTEQLHRFRRKGLASLLEIAVNNQGVPRTNVPYTLKVDGQLIQGITDQEGGITEKIPPGAKEGRLTVGEGEETHEYIIHFGNLDPLEKVCGVQERLSNLGFDCGAIDGVAGEKTKASIKDFQAKYGLEKTGKINEETLNKIRKLHGH